MTITREELLGFIDGRIEQRAAEIVGTAVEKWEERLRGVEADLQVLLGNDKVLGDNDVAFSRALGELQRSIEELRQTDLLRQSLQPQPAIKGQPRTIEI